MGVLHSYVWNHVKYANMEGLGKQPHIYWNTVVCTHTLYMHVCWFPMCVVLTYQQTT